MAFVTERLNGEDGLGAIFPAMANTVMMFDVLGYPTDHPHVTLARAAIEKLLVVKDDEAYCQPCVSPVWDTALVCHALLEAGEPHAVGQARKGLAWLEPLQVLDVAGDWTVARPQVRPGGWAFQYANPHYPDLDDTAVVVMAMDRASTLAPPNAAFNDAIARGREWVEGLQHSVRRSRRAARSANRRRDRAMPLDAGSARRDAGDEFRHAAGDRLSDPDAGARR